MMDNEHKGDIDNFCENSLVVIEKTQQKLITVYIPAYLRCHFRNMTEMDIQNLSCSFVATMNLTFYLGTISYMQAVTKNLIIPKIRRKKKQPNSLPRYCQISYVKTSKLPSKMILC